MDSCFTTDMAVCLLLWLFLAYLADGDVQPCPKPQAVLKLPGHATIAGMFDGHSGPNCTQPSSSGLQQMAAAAWIINALNEMKYIPGIKLGLALYNTCSSTATAQKTLVAAVVDMDCEDAYTLGLVTTPSILTSLQTLPDDLHVPIHVTPEPNPEKLLARTATALLVSLGHTTVVCVLAPSNQLLDSFSLAATHSRLCVLHKQLLPVSWPSLLKSSLGALLPESVVVVFGSWQQITATVQAAKKANLTSLHWVLTPLEATQDTSNLVRVPLDSLVILPGLAILQQETMNFSASSEDSSQEHEINLVDSEERLFINYPLFLSVASPILEIAQNFNASLSKICGQYSNASTSNICKQMPSFYDLPRPSSTGLETKKMAILNMLHSSDHIVLSAVSRVIAGVEGNNALEEVGVYKNYGAAVGEQQIELRLVKGTNNLTSHYEFCKLDLGSNVSLGRDCGHCINFAHYYTQQQEQSVSQKGIWPIVIWRPDAWVAAVASIAAVGITCCIVIGTFITIRMCKGDVLEGNPSFSFMLLVSIVFTYCCTLPFSLSLNDDHHYLGSLFCALRITGTSLSYAFLFSIMLSRSFMIASCDQDGGFMSHINGYLQSVLCFFIICVQLALSAQFWVINSTFLDVNQCASMYEGYYFQVLLCYDIFILILLVCTGPFAIRSKRNYREGTFFMATSILSLVIWVGWTTAYLLVPRDWQDAAISGGLTATATAVLVTVFIPRTYLMMTAIVRDNLASALPSLACTNSTSVLDLNYRATSNQVLYDCVNPVMSYSSGQVNPNFYSEQPATGATFSSAAKLDQTRPMTPDDTYERYESPASPNKVTHF